MTATYNQAQSSRLGQRVPVESTVVPAYSSEELVEAPYDGQLIFLTDTSQLMRYNAAVAAYQSIAGGGGGVDTGIYTFVQPDPPTSVHLGDIWLESDASNKMYVAMAVGVSTVDPTTGWRLVQDWQAAMAAATAAAAAAASAISAAGTAQTRADEAWDYADEGYTVSVGKNTIYYGNSKPTGGSYTDGDLWFDIDDDYHIYQYDDVANDFVDRALGSAAIADSAIIASKIMSKEIQGSHIAAGAIAADLISAGSIRAQVSVNVEGTLQVQGKNPDGTLNGASIVMDGKNGFRVIGIPPGVGKEGPTYINFPVDGAPNIISGTLNADKLTVNEGATLKGTSVVQQQSKIQLQDKVAGPLAGPTMEFTHLTNTLYDADTVNSQNMDNYQCLAYSAGYFYYAGYDEDREYGVIIRRVNADGTSTGYATIRYVGYDCWGLAVHGGKLWALLVNYNSAYLGNAAYSPILAPFDLVTLANSGSTKTIPLTISGKVSTGTVVQARVDESPASLMTDGTNLAVPYIRASDAKICVGRYSTVDGSQVGSTYVSNKVMPVALGVNAIFGAYVGSADFGASRWVIQEPVYGAMVFTLSGTTLTEQTAQQWDTVTNAHGLAYDGVNFWSLNKGGDARGGAMTKAQITRYARNYWFGSEPDKWWSCYSFFDGTNVTDVSPSSTIVMPKRAMLKLTGTASAYQERFSVARKATTPTLADFHVQSTEAAGTYFATYENVDFTTASPSTSTFPATSSNPGFIYSERNDTITINAVQTVNGSTTITATSANQSHRFKPSFVGRVVVGTGIPAGTTIVSVTVPGGATAVMSAAATASATDNKQFIVPSVEIKGDGSARIGNLLGYNAVLDSGQDATNTSGNIPALRLGNPAHEHIRLDSNEIWAMDSDNLQGSLGLQGVFFYGWDFGYEANKAANAAGEFTVSHNVGMIPTVVFAVCHNSTNWVNIFDKTATTWSGRLCNDAGGTPASTNRNIAWIAFGI